MTADVLVRTLADFLAASRQAVVREDGGVVFDLSRAKYSVSGEHGKCLLHLWSEERNAVRRVVDAEVANGVLRLAVQKLGQARPSTLEICRERDQRTPTARKAARTAYQRRLRRILERRFPDFTIAQLSSAMDLEHSFGPIYARGLLRRGRSAFAVLGVNEQETQASIDAALTFGILWMDCCRQAQAAKLLVEGLKLLVPAGASEITMERMAHLNRAAAKWQLYEVQEREETIAELDCADRGNVATRLVHAPDEQAALERFAQATARVRALFPEAEVAILSPAEVAFRCHGLEFARGRIETVPGSFRSEAKVVFGVGAEETVLDDREEGRFADLVRHLAGKRHPQGPRGDALFRLQSERWLESLVAADVSAIDERLLSTSLYSQVPAFSASDRAMIDVLSVTREGRLAVVELKAEEDIHLPLQGLDYWARVAWHHERGEFQRFGYFPGLGLSTEKPLLFLVAPALHVHPATDTVLRHLSPGIDWTLVGIDERWREGVRVIFRKRPQAQHAPQNHLAAELGAGSGTEKELQK